jgi:hypothetical protein
MTQIHTCYEVSKRLKEFLGKDAPEPITPIWWDAHPPAVQRVIGPAVDGYADNSNWRDLMREHNMPPAYQLHDLLSKPFFEAMENRMGNKDQNGSLSMLACHYFDGGMEAVEKALCEMMEGK